MVAGPMPGRSVSALLIPLFGDQRLGRGLILRDGEVGVKGHYQENKHLNQSEELPVRLTEH